MGIRGGIDEEVVRGRRDPRRDDSYPPEGRKKSSAPPEDAVPRVELARVELARVPVDGVFVESAPAEDAPVESAPPSSRRDAERPRAQVTAADPRLAELEPALRAGDWDAVLRVLGPEEDAGGLPPNLGLIYALARKEKEPLSASSAGEKAKGMDVTELAIRCTAGLVGAPADSALALVVAKRLLRKNPVAWQQRPAPPARISAIIIVIALVVGGAIGWLVAAGHLRVQLHF